MAASLVYALRMAAAMKAEPPTGKTLALRKWPRPKWPHAARLQYYRELLAIVEAVETVVVRELLPQLPAILDTHDVTRPEVEPVRYDATGGVIDDAFAGIAAEIDRVIPERHIELVAQSNALRVTAFNGAELQKQVQRVAKINLFDDTAGLAAHLEVSVADNVRLIKGLVGQHVADMQGIVLRGARQGLHHSVVADQIRARFDMPKKRAALIATDQIGKLNGELNQLRQQNMGVRRYRWSSSQDERVRPRHRVLNNTIQTWTAPPIVDERTGERGHPGQPIRCRCQPIPIIDDVLVDAGLMDPADVELGTTQKERAATAGPYKPPRIVHEPPAPKPPKLPKVPKTLPQPPPANVPTAPELPSAVPVVPVGAPPKSAKALALEAKIAAKAEAEKVAAAAKKLKLEQVAKAAALEAKLADQAAKTAAIEAELKKARETLAAFKAKLEADAQALAAQMLAAEKAAAQLKATQAFEATLAHEQALKAAKAAAAKAAKAARVAPPAPPSPILQPAVPLVPVAGRLTAAANRDLLGKLNTGLSALGPTGGDALGLRDRTRTLLQRYGMAETNIYALNKGKLTAASAPSGKPSCLAVRYGSGAIEFRTDIYGRLLTGVSRAAKGEALTHHEIDAVTTLVHEEIHGMGAARRLGTYEKTGLLIEEVATETMARAITRELLDADTIANLAVDHPLNLPRPMKGGAAWQVDKARCYDNYLAGVLEDIQQATGWEPDEVTTALEAASQTFKRRVGSLNAVDEYATAFVNDMPGLTAKQNSNLVARLIKRGNKIR